MKHVIYYKYNSATATKNAFTVPKWKRIVSIQCAPPAPNTRLSSSLRCRHGGVSLVEQERSLLESFEYHKATKLPKEYPALKPLKTTSKLRN